MRPCVAASSAEPPLASAARLIRQAGARSSSSFRDAGSPGAYSRAENDRKHGANCSWNCYPWLRTAVRVPVAAVVEPLQLYMTVGVAAPSVLHKPYKQRTYMYCTAHDAARGVGSRDVPRQHALCLMSQIHVSRRARGGVRIAHRAHLHVRQCRSQRPGIALAASTSPLAPSRPPTPPACRPLSPRCRTVTRPACGVGCLEMTIQYS